jgi:endonuclease YncB( thermonuclease family)
MNRRIQTTLHTLILLLLPSLLFAWQGRVVSVMDGDTIEVLKYDQQITIRLAAIDCPEKSQPWHKRAKKFTSHMVLQKNVLVLPTHEDHDGKMRAWIFIEEINLNKALLRAGLAWHDRKHSNESLLTALEMEARAANKGLWSEPDPIAPWAWPKQKDSKTIFEFSGGISTSIEH